MNLWVLMYHYVRNPELTKYKGIKGVREKAFKEQVAFAKRNYHIANLQEVIDHVEQRKGFDKKTVLFTFDDGLKEHANFVTEVLHENQIQGLFFIPTAPFTEHKVLPVHKNHYLLASLEIDYYKGQFVKLLKYTYPEINTEIDATKVKKTYRWDTFKVASFKYLINYILPREIRNEILTQVFNQELGSEQVLSNEIYLNWTEAKAMQEAGMVLGGHTHNHQVLSSLTEQEQWDDLKHNTQLLRNKLEPQHYFPFAYPFGKQNTYNSFTIDALKKLGIHCAFNTEVGAVDQNRNLFEINRVDPKDMFVPISKS